MIANEVIVRTAVAAYEGAVDSGPGGITPQQQLDAIIQYVADEFPGIHRTSIVLAVGAAQERIGFTTCPDGAGPGGTDMKPLLVGHLELYKERIRDTHQKAIEFDVSDFTEKEMQEFEDDAQEFLDDLFQRYSF